MPVVALQLGSLHQSLWALPFPSLVWRIQPSLPVTKCPAFPVLCCVQSAQFLGAPRAILALPGLSKEKASAWDAL